LNGGNVSTASTLDIFGGGLSGTGTVTGNVANSGGVIAPGLSAGRLEVTGDLSLGSTSQLAIEIGGTIQGVSYDTISEAGSAPLVLNGALAVTLIDGFQNSIATSNTFTILSSNMPLSGAFTNVASGGRLTTTDGLGSFRVTYAGANAVVLSDFQSGLTLTAAVSRKAHGPGGDIQYPLPLINEPGVECRSSGGAHTLVFTFNTGVVSGNASITTGVGSVSGSPTFSANTMTVNLTGVADVQRITLTLSGVTASTGAVLASTTVNMNLLAGDTNGDRTVNAGDVLQTRGRSGQTTPNSTSART
jgi:hypothetical protein